MIHSSILIAFISSYDRETHHHIYHFDFLKISTKLILMTAPDSRPHFIFKLSLKSACKKVIYITTHIDFKITSSFAIKDIITYIFY